MTFQRAITPLGLLLAGVGSVIGSGWLFGPLYAAKIAGPAALLSWIIGGVLMLVLALTFAELGTAFPLAGGMVQYAQYSHGPLVSFMTGWMVWVSSIAVAPVETMGLLQYAGNYIPELVMKVGDTTVLTSIGVMAGAVLMFFMCFLNFYGAKFLGHSNSVITLVKLIVPIATILILITTDFHSHNFVAPESGGFMAYGWHGVLAALPLGGIIYSFIGSNTVLQLAGETKNPRVSVPLALGGTLVLCIILYVLLQIAFIGAINHSSLNEGWSKLHFVGESGPFAGLLMSLGLAWFVIVIYADAIISPFGTGYIFTAATARVTYGLSKIEFLPDFFLKLTSKGVPLRAIIINFLAGLLLFLPFPGWQSMVTFIISCFIISFLIGPIALVALRKIMPDQPRPFRLPAAKTISLLAFYICNLLIFWTGWLTFYHILLSMLVGFVWFIVHCYRQKQNLLKDQWQNSWWIFPYLLSLALVSYLGTFGGGKGYIGFGADFLVIGIISIIVFFVALHTTKAPQLLAKS